MHDQMGEAPKAFGRRGSVEAKQAANGASRGPFATALLVAFATAIGWLLRPGAIRGTGGDGGFDASAGSSDGDGGGD